MRDEGPVVRVLMSFDETLPQTLGRGKASIRPVVHKVGLRITHVSCPARETAHNAHTPQSDVGDTQTLKRAL